MDGSHHDWLEGQGPKLVLMGCIDNATSTVEARFYDELRTVPALDSSRARYHATDFLQCLSGRTPRLSVSPNTRG